MHTQTVDITAFGVVNTHKYRTAATKKRCRGKMPYTISSRSGTDGVSLSVSKLKLIYSSLIFLVINSH